MQNIIISFYSSPQYCQKIQRMEQTKFNLIFNVILNT